MKYQLKSDPSVVCEADFLASRREYRYVPAGYTNEDYRLPTKLFSFLWEPVVEKPPQSIDDEIQDSIATHRGDRNELFQTLLRAKDEIRRLREELKKLKQQASPLPPVETQVCQTIYRGVKCEAPATCTVEVHPALGDYESPRVLKCCLAHADLWRHDVQLRGGVFFVHPLKESP